MITLVNKTNYPNTGHVGTGTFTLTAPCTFGNTLVVAIAENIVNGVTTSITDDAGDTFTQVNGQTFTPPPSTFFTTDIWYCLNAGAATQISFLTSGNPIIWVYEIAGSGIVFDVSGTNGVNNSGPSTNQSIGPTLNGQQVTFTDIAAATFGYGISAAGFKETSGSEFYVSVGGLQKQPVSVNAPWTLDVVSSSSSFKNLGAAYLEVTVTPTLAVSPASFTGSAGFVNQVWQFPNFTGQVRHDQPKTLTVTSSGAWSVTCDSWLKCTPSSGSGNGTVSVELYKLEQNLVETDNGVIRPKSGTYSGSVIITPNSGDPVTIPVTFLCGYGDQIQEFK